MVHYIEMHQELQDRLNELLASMVESVGVTDEDLKEQCKKLCEIYSEKDFRHSYSAISAEIEKLISDQRDELCDRLEGITVCAEQVLEVTNDLGAEEKREIRNKIAKLYDHVALESIRLSRIDEVEFISKEANKALTAADGKLKATEDKADLLEERISDYHAQSISILGIFAGLVVTFSAIMQISSSSLANISEASIENITFFISLAFFFLFNISFMLMYCISKISGKSIAVTCRRNNCSNCQKCKWIIGRLRKKYPYVLWFDVCALVLVLIICFLIK